MKIVDIYKGYAIDVWHDGEVVTIAIHPNMLTFSIPLEHLEGFFSEVAQAQESFQVRKVSEN